MSGGEFLVIILAILLLFGSKELPQIMRELGKSVREIKNATNDLKREILSDNTIQEKSEAIKKKIIESVDISQEIKEIKNELNSPAG